MFEHLVNWVTQNVGTTVGITLIILVLLGGLLWRLWQFAWRVATWVDKVNKAVKSIETIEKYFSPSPDNAMMQLINDAFSRRDIVQGQSPIALTELGEEIATAINASKIVNYYAEQIGQETVKMNAYEVQEHCFTFANNLLDDLKEKYPQDYQTISQVAFNRGKSITSILGAVVGIELRDAVLAKHGKTPAQVGNGKSSDSLKDAS